MIWLALLTALELPPAVEQGGKLFAQSCATGYCHGADGAAARGPRLRDRQFTREYLVRVTRDGIPRSAMPAWKDRFAAAEIDAVVDYIVHLNGGKIDSSKPVSPPAEAASRLPARALFQHKCAGCHQAQSLGLASGLRLDQNSRWSADPKTSRRLLTQLVLKDGEKIPARLISESNGVIILLDFTDSSPIRRSLETSEIASRSVVPWDHPAVSPTDWNLLQPWLMLP